MYRETLNALLGLFSGFEDPIYLSEPDPRVYHPGDHRLIPGEEPSDPRISRILIQPAGDDYDPKRSANACIDYELYEADSSAMVIPWPQPWTERFQVEFKGTRADYLNGLREKFLNLFNGFNSFNIEIAWNISGQVIQEDCEIRIDDMRDLSRTWNNQRRIRKIIIVEIDTWRFSQDDPSGIPLISERILHRGNEIDGEDIRYSRNLEE